VAKRSPRPRGRHHEPCQASQYQNRRNQEHRFSLATLSRRRKS
jgi:hypothetical protein